MIRKAINDDIEIILKIFDMSRNYMKNNGNPTQWPDSNYPNIDIIKADILNGNLYIVERDGKVAACFSFILGEDSTYANIYNGEWLNNNAYGTIHRLASLGITGGIFEEVFKFCVDMTDEIRVDTHKNNTKLRKKLIENGFLECGVIFVEDGTERIAYHYSRCNSSNK